MNNVYNAVSLVFLVATLAVCLCTVSILGGVVSPPDSFLPQPTEPVPTLLQVNPTLRPSATPTASNTPIPPTWTPQGGGALSNPASAATPEGQE